MLVYTGNKSDFIYDVINDTIDGKVEALVRQQLHKRVGKSERQSWQNSLQYMYKVLSDEQIPATSGVAIEFNIPQTAKRVDFILTGFNQADDNQAVIIELKQWSEVFPVKGIDALLEAGGGGSLHEVETFLGGGRHVTVHPSYQAWSYKSLIEDFNANVQEVPINLQPCAYLHNYVHSEKNDPLFLPHFQEFLTQAPVFCKGDVLKLRNFIKKYIKRGDDRQTLYYIEQGKIRPSKSLQDSLVSMLSLHKREFMLIDDQEIVYQRILSCSKLSMMDDKKRVFIVHGGPGTGKTVVAINLLVSLINAGQVCAYVTKNSAPRYVFETRLQQGAMKKRNISNLFKSSGAFIDASSNDFGTLLVDEAHRLNKRTQLGPSITGEDQVKELITASRCTVFFIDEEQRVTAQDYGSVQTIKDWAARLGAEVQEGELLSQFRCNGSDGYLSWLDNTLGIRETANETLEGIEYDFKVFDDLLEMKQQIYEKNGLDGKARLLAGYCWEWVSKKNSELMDIQIGDFSMQWNLSGDKTFAISEGSIEQVGCIHTSQGLEFRYVGVIIGEDMRFEHDMIVTDYKKRATSDKSLHGLLGPAKKGDVASLKAMDEIIRNTYRTLMTRGMRGCYVYCCDKALAAYLKRCIENPGLYTENDATLESVAADLF